MSFEIEGSFKLEEDNYFLLKKFYLLVYFRVKDFLENNGIFFIEDEGVYHETMRLWENEHFYDEDYDEARKVFEIKYKLYVLNTLSFRNPNVHGYSMLLLNDWVAEKYYFFL